MRDLITKPKNRCKSRYFPTPIVYSPQSINMRPSTHAIVLILLFFSGLLHAQDSTAKAQKYVFTKADTLYMAKLNSTGNLMIAGGVGLNIAGGYLIYQGVKVYTSKLPNQTPEEEQRNKRQGIIYWAAGGVAVAGGMVLTALGARNKVEFKRRQRLMQLQGGILPNGMAGLALSF